MMSGQISVNPKEMRAMSLWNDLHWSYNVFQEEKYRFVSV